VYPHFGVRGPVCKNLEVGKLDEKTAYHETCRRRVNNVVASRRKHIVHKYSDDVVYMVNMVKLW
jgi:hypothetical protein